MTKLTSLTIKQALEGLKNKQFSCIELAEEHVAAMEKHHDMNLFITETADIARNQAHESD